jgi:hypothetical protein
LSIAIVIIAATTTAESAPLAGEGIHCGAGIGAAVAIMNAGKAQVQPRFLHPEQ